MIITLNSDHFGHQLRRQRTRQRISQKALAAGCHISVYRLRCLEQGRIREVEHALMQDLCTKLGCTMEELVNSTDLRVRFCLPRLEKAFPTMSS